MKVAIILAVANNGVIGNNNTLVWRLKSDLQHFKKLTSQHTVIMGRKTFESIGKPLVNRENIVVTRDPNKTIEGCKIAHSLQEALAMAQKMEKDIFVIGGAEIYRQALPYTDKIYLTKVDADPVGDAYFDLNLLDGFMTLKSDLKIKDLENEFDARYEELIRK